MSCQRDEEARIRVMIVEDHALFRRGLVLTLAEAGIAVVGEAPDLLGARRLVGITQPDVALIDVRLPDGDGLEFCDWLAKRFPRVGAIMLSSFREAGFIEAAMSAGARAYVTKDMDPQQLVAAIERVVASPEQRWFPDVERASLTPREQEVAEWLVRGASNGEIAAALGIGTATVKDHVAHLLGKLCARDRAEAAALSVRLGYVRWSPPNGGTRHGT